MSACFFRCPIVPFLCPLQNDQLDFPVSRKQWINYLSTFLLSLFRGVVLIHVPGLSTWPNWLRKSPNTLSRVREPLGTERKRYDADAANVVWLCSQWWFCKWIRMSACAPQFMKSFRTIQPKQAVFNKYIKPLSDSLAKYSGKSSSYYQNTITKARSNKNRYFLLARNISYSDYLRLRSFPMLELGAIKGLDISNTYLSNS